MSEELASGTVVAGRYRLDHPLGEGGMGTVWAATNTVTRLPVALKVLKAPEHGGAELRQRLVREARAACAVRHPNVVRVFDVLELDDGSPAIVMEQLSGEPLRALLRREHRLELSELCQLLLPVVSAVGSAHALGIVHRDLKPDNIFLADEGIAGTPTVKVLDFGIARLTAADGPAAETVGLTATGSLVGTPTYMSPEQAFGDKGLDHRTDIWSLGLIIYQALSGVLPTAADTVGQVFKIIARGRFEPLEELVEGLPEDVVGLIARMLAAKPEERPRDLREVLEVLERHTEVRVPSFTAPRRPDEADDTAPAETALERSADAGQSADPAPVAPDDGDQDDDQSSLPTVTVASDVPTGGEGDPPAEAQTTPSSAQTRSAAERGAAALWRWGALLAVAVLGGAFLYWRSGPGRATDQPPAGSAQPSAMGLGTAGLDAGRDEAFESALAPLRPSIQECYTSSLASNPGLEGEIELQVALDAAGGVQQVDVLRETLGNPAVAACIITQLGAMEVPSAAGRIVKVPFSFWRTRALVVFSFANLGADASLDWLRGGIAEALRTKLGQLPSLALVDRTKVREALADLGANLDAADAASLVEAAKALGAQRAVIGTFQRAGFQLRCTARLLQAEDGEVLATAEATGELEQLFDLQDDLARQLAAAMKIAASPASDAALALRTGGSVAILRLLGKAANALDGVGEARDAAKAAALFRQVIELDPNIPEAHLGLAQSLWKRAFTDEEAQTIRAELDRAIELRPNYYEAIVQLGFLCHKTKQYEQALAAQRQAVKLKPQYADAYHGLALAHATAGRGAEALALMKQAVDLDPDFGELQTSYGLWLATFKRDFTAALEHTGAATEQPRPIEWAFIVHAYVQLMAGDGAGCLRSVEQGRKVRNEQFNYAGQSVGLEIACTFAKGDRAAAEKLFSSLPPEVQRGFESTKLPPQLPAFTKIIIEDTRKVVAPLLE